MPPPSGPSHWLPALLLATLYQSAPLILAAMGGVLSERAGVVNIALEGLILAGAFAAVAFGTGSAGAGLAAALAVGALLGALHAFLTQAAKMNHVVSGLGITLLAAGGTRYLWNRLFEGGVSAQGIPQWGFAAAALALPFALAWALRRTRFGLRLRAVGEDPESARMAGVAVGPPRYLAVTLSGVLGAAAGACLSLGAAHTFTPGMSAGKGYIALAAVIFGKWNPVGATLGALFFGFFYAVQTQLQISGVKLTQPFGVEWTSPFLLDNLPYVMTLLALVSVIGRAVPPAALGKEED